MRRFFLALALSIALAGNANARAMTMTVTQITAHYAPYFIAIDKGYFAEGSITMSISEAAGGSATAALMAGRIDFTASAASTVNAILRGAKLRVIYTMADRPAYQLRSTAPELKTLADLKGKQVGISSRGDTYEIAMRLALMQAGLPQDWVGYTPLGVGGARDAALVSGSLPAIVIPTSELAPLKGNPALARGHVVVDMFDAIRMPYTGIATSAHLVDQEPQVAMAFLRGVVKGMRYMRAFPDATLALLHTHAPQVDPRQMEADYRDTIATATADGTAPDALVRADLAVRAELLNLPKDKLPPADHVYDYAPLRQVLKELDASGWKPER
jgi:ABC-type nitrate/sulfonate/bicarbonate transport system substrate-binding protein